MTAKEFTQLRLPNAKAERQITMGKQQYWLIRDGRDTMWIASGNSESNAWVNAKERIIQTESEQNK